MSTPQMRHVAVIGSGVAGLSAAYVLSSSCRVTLFEADARLGGHADTQVVPGAAGPVAIDTGFIVHNERTYPTLIRIFGELGVPTQPADMSMSVRADHAHGGAGLEYAGARGLRGLFPTLRNLARPRYLRMLTEVPRFHRRARALLATGEHSAGADQRLADFLDEGRFSDYFREHFVAPLIAAVWSCDPRIAEEYPARYLFAFLRNHGMLSVTGSPQWRTVTGGSHVYVQRIAETVRERGGEVRLQTKITSIAELSDGVELTDGNGRQHAFDSVVVATHPDQALGILADPSPLQREVLAAMPYSRNLAQLHTDADLLPRHRGAWGSWNHLERPGHDGVTVTYDLTRLMRLPSPDGTRYLVTLGGTDIVDPDRVISTRDYAHPIYTPESVAAQRRLPEIDTDRIAFAGAYHGWGFHEDGARSGVAAAARLGAEWPEPDRSRPAEPRLYRTTIRHTRRTPFRNRFTHRGHLWTVDLDQLPDHGRLGWLLGSFEARDHLGDPHGTLRGNVEAFCARHGIALDGGRILMAAHARALGHCFNPISVFWCHNPSGRLVATVVEVHNTYGDRHAYLVDHAETSPAESAGAAVLAKQMYVSPFHGTDGHYEVTAPVPGDRLVVTVRLTTEDGARFDASVIGRPATGGRLRAATSTWRTSALIRLHGIGLWLRRLPVQPRPIHHQEGVR